MAKGRKTTQEERGKIVAFCIEHGKDYPLTIQTYGVSYQQIYAWVRKYEEKGIDGLRDGRGNECRRAPSHGKQDIESAAQRCGDGKQAAKKIAGVERGRWISGVRQEDYYKVIQNIHISEEYPIEKLYRRLHVNRSAYYKWLKRTPSDRQIENEQIAEWIKTLYEKQDGILGYRQMTITVSREYSVHYNKKRIRRLMQILHLKSVCRRKRYNYIPSTPELTAENILNRDFHADEPNEKWLTDVTEFKYYVGVESGKYI